MYDRFNEVNITITPKPGRSAEFKKAVEKFSVLYNGTRNAFQTHPDGAYSIDEGMGWSGFTAEDYDGMLHVFDGLLAKGDFDLCIYGGGRPKCFRYCYSVLSGRFVSAGPEASAYFIPPYGGSIHFCKQGGEKQI